MGHIRSQFSLVGPENHSIKPVFLDTQVVSQLTKLYPKFKNLVKKDAFKFPPNLVDLFNKCFEADRFYFPFNLDKKHWVGVCVDFASWSLVMLDCNIALRSDSLMAKEVKHISQMFPHLLRVAGKMLQYRDARSLPLNRPRAIPQNSSVADSAAAAVLLIQAHAVAGIDVCKCITPDAIGGEVERLAVTFFEANVGSI